MQKHIDNKKQIGYLDAEAFCKDEVTVTYLGTGIVEVYSTNRPHLTIKQAVAIAEKILQWRDE